MDNNYNDKFFLLVSNDNFLVNHFSFSLRQCIGNINSDSHNTDTLSE